MRIAVATRHRDHVGGVETYLERLLPVLDGHARLLWHEFDDGRTPMALPAGIECVSVRARGRDDALAALVAWKPDVIFVHGLSDPALEADLQRAAPSVLLLHTYHGTCVGGTKTHAFPRPAPCARALGPGCLVRYFPRRCGGLSPLTMISRYRTESAHRALLDRYAAVTTLSRHMRDEATRHGADPSRVHVLPPPVDGAADTPTSPAKLARLAADRRADDAIRLLFLGRLERVKGGAVLIEAAASAATHLRRQVELVVAGEGRCRDEWGGIAARLAGAVAVSFPGRADADARARWFEWADLLVVPSLWPEPFGLVGGEAAAAGLPAVAFDVGGTSDWLDDGRTGRLVRERRAGALVDALVWVFDEPGRLRALSEGARARAAGWSMPRHRDALVDVLRRAAGDLA